MGEFGVQSGVLRLKFSIAKYRNCFITNKFMVNKAHMSCEKDYILLIFCPPAVSFTS